jgi:hypothetical protein
VKSFPSGMLMSKDSDFNETYREELWGRFEYIDPGLNVETIRFASNKNGLSLQLFVRGIVFYGRHASGRSDVACKVKKDILGCIALLRDWLLEVLEDEDNLTQSQVVSCNESIDQKIHVNFFGEECLQRAHQNDNLWRAARQAAWFQIRFAYTEAIDKNLQESDKVDIGALTKKLCNSDELISLAPESIVEIIEDRLAEIETIEEVFHQRVDEETTPSQKTLVFANLLEWSLFYGLKIRFKRLISHPNRVRFIWAGIPVVAIAGVVLAWSFQTTEKISTPSRSTLTLDSVEGNDSLNFMTGASKKIVYQLENQWNPINSWSTLLPSTEVAEPEEAVVEPLPEAPSQISNSPSNQPSRSSPSRTSPSNRPSSSSPPQTSPSSSDPAPAEKTEDAGSPVPVNPTEPSGSDVTPIEQSGSD